MSGREEGGPELTILSFETFAGALDRSAGGESESEVLLQEIICSMKAEVSRQGGPSGNEEGSSPQDGFGGSQHDPASVSPPLGEGGSSGCHCGPLPRGQSKVMGPPFEEMRSSDEIFTSLLLTSSS